MGNSTVTLGLPLQKDPVKEGVYRNFYVDPLFHPPILKVASTFSNGILGSLYVSPSYSVTEDGQLWHLAFNVNLLKARITWEETVTEKVSICQVCLWSQSMGGLSRLPSLRWDANTHPDWALNCR